MKSSIAGLILIVTGWMLMGSSHGGLATGALKATFVDARAAEAAAHDDGPDRFNRDRLREMANRFDHGLRTLPLLIGLALLVFPVVRLRSPGVGAPLSVAILTAIFGGALVLTEQASLIAEGARDGVFTEGEDARTRRFFGEQVVRAAAMIKEVVPEDAHLLVIRVGLPRDLNAFGYLIFPRRVFMPPKANIQLEGAAFRKIILARPDAIAPYIAAGYTHAVDLRRLIADADPDAIIPLAKAD